MRQVFIACGLAISAISCNGPEPLQVNARFVSTCPTAAVKSSLVDDSRIEKLDLLLFRTSDGKLETRAASVGSSTIEITVPRDREMKWYMVANAPEGLIPECHNLEDFLNDTVLLEDGFVMHDQGIFTFRENGATVTASLSRYLCKVGIGSITIDWADALPCSVETVALMNVQGSAPISGEPTDLPLRYNCGVIDSGLGAELEGMLSARPCITIESSSPANIGVTLWCMPNPSDGNSYGLPWQNRRTRIALCIKAQGLDNWYPIDLPPMEGNRYYLVDNIVIKGPGANAPDVKPERIPALFTIRVLDWEEEITPAQF